MSRSLKNLKPIQDHIIDELKAPCVPIECDCSNPESIKAAFDEIKSKIGDVDVLVYNVGYAPPKRVKTEDPAAQGLVEAEDLAHGEMAYRLHVLGLMACAQQV